MHILVATRNAGKLQELSPVLEDCGFEVCSLAEWDELPDVEEDGDTFAENARKKALHFHRLCGLPTVADDSGLEVEALGGRPGVFSARYAATDAERIARLLYELRDVPAGTPRRARFVCALCLVTASGQRVEVEGQVQGEILEAARGSNGFGYDPIFYYPPRRLSFAELTRHQKDAVSHRADALRKLDERLRDATL